MSDSDASVSETAVFPKTMCISKNDMSMSFFIYTQGEIFFRIFSEAISLPKQDQNARQPNALLLMFCY